VTQAGISDASEFLDEVVERVGGEGPKSVAPALHVILDEIASNIVRHSGASGFEVDVEFSSAGAKLEFIDDGTPYDPLTHVDPDTTLKAEDRAIGGLGIMMVKKMASSVSYRRDRSRNFLIVKVAEKPF
jgi:anti-sigma regulatory factor (Ser/Thr protein kinase)